VSALDSVLRTDPQGIVRFQAAKALERLGTLGIDVSVAAPALLAGLRNTSTFEIRCAAAGALGRAGFNAQKGPNRDVLVELVKTDDTDRCLEVRLEVIRALILLGRPIQLNDVKAEEQALLRLTGNKHTKKEQIWARVALLRLAQKIEGDKTSEKYLTDIAHFLKSAEYQTRLDAAHAFATIGREAKSHLNDLIEALDDKEPAVLLYVCLALGEMHDAAEKAVPHLKRIQEQDSNETVKAAAKEAIAKISEKVKVEEKPPQKRAP